MHEEDVKSKWENGTTLSKHLKFKFIQCTFLQCRD